MTTLLAFVPGSALARGFATLRKKQHQLSHRWHRARVRRQEVSRITRELQRCTDRDLSDLGLCRSDIPSVARRTFRRD